MTEADWLAAADPDPMVRLVEPGAGDRKRRLYAAACCRLLQQHGLLKEPLHQESLAVVEQYADGQARDRRLRQVRDALAAATRHGAVETASGFATWTLQRAAATRGHVAGSWVSEGCRSALTTLTRGDRPWSPEVHGEMRAAADRVRSVLASLMRCVFGNVFRPVTIDPAWLTSAVVAVARLMYEARDFSAMPILADALQDAGGENADALAHCRGDGPHARGCWVVDLLLGKG